MPTFGERLRELRLKKGLSQRELGRLVDLDFTYISKIENGATDPPSEEKIRDLARVLEGDEEELLLLARKVPPAMLQVIVEHPEVPRFLRSAGKITDETWAKILELAEGKGDGSSQVRKAPRKKRD